MLPLERNVSVLAGGKAFLLCRKQFEGPGQDLSSLARENDIINNAALGRVVWVGETIGVLLDEFRVGLPGRTLS